MKRIKEGRRPQRDVWQRNCVFMIIWTAWGSNMSGSTMRQL